MTNTKKGKYDEVKEKTKKIVKAMKVPSLTKDKVEKYIFGDYHETSFSIFYDIYFPAVFFGSALSPAKTFFEKTDGRVAGRLCTPACTLPPKGRNFLFRSCRTSPGPLPAGQR